MADKDTAEAIYTLAHAVHAVAFGGESGPAGLELLAMAVSGEGPFTGENNVTAVLADVSAALDGISTSVRVHAEAMNRIAAALELLVKGAKT